MKQCCLTCVFCRKKLIKDDMIFTLRKIDLSIEDVNNILVEKFENLDKEILEYANWEKELKKKKEERLIQLEEEEDARRKRKVCSPSYSYNKLMLSNDFDAYKVLEMEPPPFGPIKEIKLFCEEERWKDILIQDISKRTELFEESNCYKYYSIEDKGEKSIDACKKERDFKLMSNAKQDINIEVNPTINNKINQNNNQTLNINIKNICKDYLDKNSLNKIEKIVNSSIPKEEKDNKIIEFLKNSCTNMIPSILANIITNYWI